jgi:hypothetical protein
MKLLGSDTIHWRAHFPFVVRNSRNMCLCCVSAYQSLPTYWRSAEDASDGVLRR